jgi:hypothetical protein
MATIYRPCYATREDVMSAMDVKLAQYNSTKIDRAILSGAESVDSLCQRKFYFEDATRFWDWPNYQYAYPWRVWFDKAELADVTVNVPVVTSGGVLIPNNSILWGDPQEPTAPFTYMELDRSANSAFGNGPTPQREISIKGTYGYWIKTVSAGTLGASMGASDLTMTVSDGATPGVGDVAIIDSERILVTDAAFVSTGITPSSGATTASAADCTVSVPSGPAFSVSEVIQMDSEWMLIQGITGNNLIVKRGWGGSILAIHATPVIWARRLLTVMRGQLGTTAATHNNNAPIVVSAPPGLVKTLNVAEAILTITGETGAYAYAGAAGQSGTGTTLRSSGTITYGSAVREPLPGPGVPVIRDQVLTQYGRKVRTRVI